MPFVAIRSTGTMGVLAYKGIILLSNNQVYYGDLVNGIPEGEGVAVYKGDYFEYYSGAWGGGKPNGHGTVVEDASIDYSYNGVFYGTGVGTWTSEGDFVDGVGDGPFVRTLRFSSGYLAGGYAVYHLSVNRGKVVSGLSPVDIGGMDFWPMNFDNMTDVYVTGYMHND